MEEEHGPERETVFIYRLTGRAIHLHDGCRVNMSQTLHGTAIYAYIDPPVYHPNEILLAHFDPQGMQQMQQATTGEALGPAGLRSQTLGMNESSGELNLDIGTPDALSLCDGSPKRTQQVLALKRHPQ